MALDVRQQTMWWGGGLVLLLLVFYYLGGALTPFIVGAGLAYCLDPLADRLEAAGLSRTAATAVITLAALVFFFGVILLVLPFVVRQAASLIDALPGMVGSLREFLAAQFPNQFGDGAQLQSGFSYIQQKVAEAGPQILDTVLSWTGASGAVILNFVLLAVVSPVVAFYLLLDWDRMVAKIDSWLPLDHKETIRGLASEVDGVLAAFLRGQLTVMLFLASFYSIGMLVIGLNFGVVVGIIAGLISFIPYVGTIVGGGLALALAAFQFWNDPIWILAVLAVFVAGQFIEGNILTPKIVGNSVGLHPVWLMFALSAFGTLFGFFGMLIAVPVAASLGVLARFVLGLYLNGRLYKGLAGRDAAE